MNTNSLTQKLNTKNNKTARKPYFSESKACYRDFFYYCNGCRLERIVFWEDFGTTKKPHICCKHSATTEITTKVFGFDSGSKNRKHWNKSRLLLLLLWKKKGNRKYPNIVNLLRKQKEVIEFFYKMRMRWKFVFIRAIC